MTYATERMLFEEDSERYDNPVYIPAVLLPYLAMSEAKAADPEKHPSHRTEGGDD